MALDLCKYYKKQEYVSYNDGMTWQPLDNYERGELYESHSSSCGAGIFQYRWMQINNGYICDEKDRYSREIYQYSEDGQVWYNVWPTQYRKGFLIESNSPFCDNAGNGQYSSGGTDPTSGETGDCPPNYVWNGYECICVKHLVNGECKDCPQNSTWNGSRCVCKKWWEMRNGVCVYVDPLKTIKCEDSNGILTSGDVVYYESGWSVLSYTIGDCITKIDDNAFNGQTMMYSVEIPNSVTEVGILAFGNCKNLETLTFPSSLTSLGNYAFNKCENLKYVTFGGTIPSTLNTGLFAQCVNLESASWLQTNNITSIGDTAFINCYKLSNVVLPQTLTTIGVQAFKGCHSLSTIEIPSGVTNIGHSAFQYCNNLTNVRIVSPNITFGLNVFANCPSLTAVTIDSSSVTMGDNVFSGCTRLLKMTFTSPTPFAISEGEFDNTNNCMLFVPCESLQAYKTAWSQYADRISCNDTGVYYRWIDTSGTYCEGTDAYTRQKEQSTTNGITWSDTGNYRPITLITHYSPYCGYVGDVALTVTNQDGYTRYYEPCDYYRTVSGAPYCSGETRLDKYVEEYYQRYDEANDIWVTTATSTVLVEANSQDCINAQYRWTNSGTTCVDTDLWQRGIKQVSIDSGQTWYNYIPETYSALTLIDTCSTTCAKAKLTYVDSSVRCIPLNSSTELTSGETRVNASSTSYKNITSVVIGDNVTSIGDSAFTYCSGITSVSIGRNVTTIGKNAFIYCSGLTSIYIPDSVTTINQSAFAGLYGLTTLDLPDSVRTINGFAFSTCNSLTSCTIGSGITSIGRRAFQNCSSLQSLTIRATSVPSLADGEVFLGTNNCPIYVRPELVNKYKANAYWSGYASRIQPIT